MNEINDNSVALIVTSPPYPMIEMWNGIFSSEDGRISDALEESNGDRAFILMHKLLEKVWDEVDRILIPGGIACINIGDATKTINNIFQVYPNHVMITNYFIKKGFVCLPNIIWRKPTNSPNKFMGSGTLAPGAYVTLEHEYILIFRKGNKREFKTEHEKLNRRQSSYFWEERNTWFSDLWEINGTSQKSVKNTERKRTGAFPFEIAYRLINMFSVKGDTVVDPFLGTGTTSAAAIVSERNSIGYDIGEYLSDTIFGSLLNHRETFNEYIDARVKNHINFIENFKESHELKYINKNHNFYVRTRQELDLKINKISGITKDNNIVYAEYSDL